MEDSLGRCQCEIHPNHVRVLILVVMEDSLGLACCAINLLSYAGLNPCCNGR